MKYVYTIFLSILLFGAAYAHTPSTDLGEPFLKEFSVYPNPSSGNITLSFQATDAGRSLDVKIYSLIGQEMYSQSFAPFSGVQRLELNLGNYPKGIYMVEISDGNQKRVKRISII